MKDCPICFKEYDSEIFKCTCGYQTLKKYDKNDYLFEIYKFSKNIFNKKICFNNALLGCIEENNKIIINEVHEKSYSICKVENIYDKYTIASEGILAYNVYVKSLIIDVEELKWNLLDESNVRMLFIGSRLKKIDGVNLNHSYILKYLEVSEDNEYFSSENNVLFDKKKKTLLNYSGSKKEEEYFIPNTVEKVVCRAFNKCENLKIIHASKKVRFEKNALYLSENIKIIYDL